MARRKYKETPFSQITKPDLDVGNLNGMPTSMDIEDIVILREQALEKLKTLPLESPQYRQIQTALGDVMGSHARADHHDGGNQCSDRGIIRGLR